MAYRADGLQIAAGSISDCIAFIDLLSQTVRRTQQTHESYVTSMAFTHDGTALLTGDNYGIIKGNLVFRKRWKEVQLSIILGASVNNITFSPDGESFAVATLRGVNIYSTKTRKISHILSTKIMLGQ